MGAGRKAGGIVTDLTEAGQVSSFGLVFGDADPSGRCPDQPLPMEYAGRFAGSAPAANIGPDLDPF
jgi:hypothetical protein